MIGIRVDANEIVATGHILRCITIAKEIEKHGETVLFFLADEYGVSFLREENFQYIILNTKWNCPEEEIDRLIYELEKNNINVMLFDSYKFTKKYYEKIRTKTKDDIKLCYIDDLFEDIYPVDLIINYNAYHTKFPYREKYGDNSQLLLGPEYVPLRGEFSNALSAKKVNTWEEDKKHILLSCGGGDILQIMREILNAYIGMLESEKENIDDAGESFLWSNTVWHVIVGRFTTSKEELFQLGEVCQNIQIHYDVHNMAELMARCDIAVSAAGTMLYELCAMQCPTVFFITADNQKYDSDFFAVDNRMIGVGDVRNNRKECIEKILQGVQLLLTTPTLYDIMKRKLGSITDGKGAKKIAKELCKLKERKAY